ncbi:MAG: ATP-binding protein [Chloroflexia bacterium]
MPIRHKIFFGYLLIVAVTVVMVAVFLVTLADISARYSDLLDRKQIVLMQANGLRAAVQREVVAARTYEQLKDPLLLTEYQTAVTDQQRAISAMRPLLTEQDDIEALKNIQQAGDKYTAFAQRALGHAASGAQEILDSTGLSQGETARRSLIQACDAFIALKSRDVVLGEADLAYQVGDASSRLLLGAIIGVLAALIAATLLTQGITAPLRRLVRNIQGISAGDLRTTVTVKSQDEVGELAAVLETLRQRLAAAADQNQALLDSAREEAEKLAATRQDLELANADLEEALAIESEARRHIEEINRLKTEFAGMVSHELKTPASYVYNYAAALKEHNQSLNEGQRHEFLSAIQSEAFHLLTLIDDILAVSLLETGGLVHRFVETDLRKLTDSVVRDQQLTTRRHTLTVKGPSTLPVYADPNRLKQVLNNLLSNALKYSPQGGPIEVRLRANPGDGTALIYVRDYGIGIRPDDVPKLFDRFTRIQRRETMAIPGSGLGLYISHHIIQAHKGTLSLEPAPGKGTIAQVTLPLMPGATIEGVEATFDGTVDEVEVGV